jgi:spermidine synthase
VRGENPLTTRLDSNLYNPWLLLLFFGSGCAALIYEIVWLQLLELVIGSSGISLGILLGTFMGGMCLGSLLLPRLISSRHHPLRVYACLELGIGLLGVAVMLLMPSLAQLYTIFPWHGAFMRALIAAVCLIPPTLLLGATLPAVARFVKSTPEGVAWMGLFYGGNTLGAVVGCLLAGFVLLRVLDMSAATLAAASINLAVAVTALLVAKKCPYTPQPPRDEQPSINGTPRVWPVYLVIAMSGFGALGAEVVWTRLLSLLMGATVYSFSIILSVFLVGLGIGSLCGSLLARTASNPRFLLGLCQGALALGIAWAAFVISKSLPYWPINPGLYTNDWGPWHLFQLDILRAAWAVLPATIFWGASFPLAIAAVAPRSHDSGRMVGEIYAANTLGAIAGSLSASMLIIPRLGTQQAERLLIIVSTVSALLALVPSLSKRRLAENETSSRGASFSLLRITVALAGILIAAFLVDSVSRVPWVAIAWGRFSATYMAQSFPEIVDENKTPVDSHSPSKWHCTYVGEGMNVSVAVTKSGAGARFFHGAGKVQASSQPQDMRLQRMLGHISALSCKNPEKVENVLVVACGAGVTAGSFVPYPSIKRIVICDIEPLVPRVVAPMFGHENYHIVDGIDKNNPRRVNGKEVSVIYDDGRHYIRTLPPEMKFDVITSDPIDPWVKGSAALNTVEYYEMCKRHLSPGGVMSLWIPLYESNSDSAKSIIATFFKVFPNGLLFSNDQHYEGYDAVLLGTNEPGQMDLDRLQALLNRNEYSGVRESLMDGGFGMGGSEPYYLEHGPAIDLLATYAGQASHLQKWTANAQINRDNNLRLQYLAGMWFNSNLGTKILQDILACYKFPDEVFIGSQENIWLLKQALAVNGRISK